MFMNFFLCLYILLNPLSANPTKWSNTLKQFVGNLPTNCLSAFDHFVGLVLKGFMRYHVFMKKSKKFELLTLFE